MTKQPESSKTNWHHLIGTLLEALLTPMGIAVYLDMPVMSEPPEADIILLRREGSRWTKKQRANLPDGIRDSRASHILIEFKYSESLNEKAYHQALGYNYFYAASQKLKRGELQTFLMVSKTPRDSTLKRLDWKKTRHAGIYQGRNTAINPLKLIVLNELSKESHNAWVKCFASRQEQKELAFDILDARDLDIFGQKLNWITQGLLRYLGKGGDYMKGGMTPEKLIELGREWQNLLLSGLKLEELEDRVADLELEELEKMQIHIKKIMKAKKKKKQSTRQ